MFRRLSPLLKLLFWVTALYGIADALVIRTGFYFKYLEPESIAGSVLLNRTVVAQRLDSNRSNIIVVGDSQVGEGFSAKLANEIAIDTKLNFIGCGISGSTPRVWRYFLRQVDPQRKKFKAIILMANAISDEDIVEDFENYKLDLNYCLPLLTWSDWQTFPQSFPNPALCERARRSIAFPIAFAQNDLKALLMHPVQRIRKVALWQSGYPTWIYDYPARPESLPNLILEGSPAQPRDWQGVPDSLRPQLGGYFAQAAATYPHPPLASVSAYRKKWYGDIARDYLATGVPVYVFLMPRGPYHAQLKGSPVLAGTLAELAAKNSIRFLPPEPFGQLEVASNFFDQLHLNAIGRGKLTDLLAREIMAREQKSSSP